MNRMPMESSAARWYAVYCKSRHERAVSKHVAEKGLSAYVADYETRVLWGRRARRVLRNLLPGYVLLRVNMDSRSYLTILQTPGVVRLVGSHWPRLSWIPDEQMESLQRVLRSQTAFMEVPYWHTGDKVEVSDGPLAGVQGYVAGGTNRANHVVVSIDLLQRSVAVEVEASSLRRLESATGAA